MKVSYFEDTDTLYIELRHGPVAETRDIDENTLVDVDEGGDMLAITIEHAKTRAELSQFMYERVSA
jgi:uncharacterized protein YuzE